MTSNQIAKNFPELCIVGKVLHRYSVRHSMLLTPCNKSVGHALHLHGFDEAEGVRRCPRCFPQ